MASRLASNFVYTNSPYHRPLTDRDLFMVQDCVRVTSGNDGGTWFYTYNHEVDHHYFAPRSGFVRAKMKYQGMVGVLGDAGKTRLTWLVNIDFGGAVPSSFMNAMIVNLMIFPLSVVEHTKNYLQKQEDAAQGKFVHKLQHQSEERDGAGNETTLESKRESAAELKLKAELAEMKAAMVRKDEAPRRKDEEHRIALTQKDKAHQTALRHKDEEIMELRRRRRRVVEEE